MMERSRARTYHTCANTAYPPSLAFLKIEIDLFSLQSVIVVVYRMVVLIACCHSLFLCFPLCWDDEEMYYTLRGVGDYGLIAIVVRLNVE